MDSFVPSQSVGSVGSMSVYFQLTTRTWMSTVTVSRQSDTGLQRVVVALLGAAVPAVILVCSKIPCLESKIGLIN
jgi:hypothetical protein